VRTNSGALRKSFSTSGRRPAKILMPLSDNISHSPIRYRRAREGDCSARPSVRAVWAARSRQASSTVAARLDDVERAAGSALRIKSSEDENRLSKRVAAKLGRCARHFRLPGHPRSSATLGRLSQHRQRRGHDRRAPAAEVGRVGRLAEAMIERLRNITGGRPRGLSLALGRLSALRALTSDRRGLAIWW